MFSAEQEHERFTVYFVSTFRYSKKQFLVCIACHEGFEVAKELKPELAAKLMSQQELSSMVRHGRLKELASGGKRDKARKAARDYCPGCGGEVAANIAYCPQCSGKLK